MTARENEPERIRRLRAYFLGTGDHADFMVPALREGAAPDLVDGLVPGGRHEPGDRILGRFFRPLHMGRGKCFLEGVLGKGEVTDDSNQAGQDSSILAAVDFAEVHA